MAQASQIRAGSPRPAIRFALDCSERRSAASRMAARFVFACCLVSFIASEGHRADFA